jgi:hypothetical protein
MKTLGLTGIPGVEGHLDHFANPDCFKLTAKRESNKGALKETQVTRGTLPKVEFARLFILPRASRRKRHV